MSCKTKSANTNEGRCKFDMDLLQKAIIVPENTEFTGDDIDEFLIDGIHNSDPGKRFYPMPMFTGVTDNSTEATTTTNGYGYTRTMRPGVPSLTQNYAKNYCLSNRLFSFNDGVRRGVYFIDYSGHVWGTKGKNGGLKAFSVSIWANAAGIPTPDADVEPSIRYDFQDVNQWNQKQVENTDLSVSDLEGLEDVELAVTTSDSNKVVKMLTACGGEDITDEFAAISGVADAFMKVSASGVKTAFTTAPTYDDQSHSFTFATSEVSGSAGITLAAPDVLFENGVTYKCCDKVTPLS